MSVAPASGCECRLSQATQSPKRAEVAGTHEVQPPLSSQHLSCAMRRNPKVVATRHRLRVRSIVKRFESMTIRPSRWSQDGRLQFRRDQALLATLSASSIYNKYHGLFEIPWHLERALIVLHSNSTQCVKPQCLALLCCSVGVTLAPLLGAVKTRHVCIG